VPPTDLPPWVLQARIAVGRSIRTHRERADISQELLAERSGVSRDTVVRAELAISGISLDVLARIAHGLDIPPAALLPDDLDA
jgi:transcriptional regulator with XRE-family HTH domain